MEAEAARLQQQPEKQRGHQEDDRRQRDAEHGTPADRREGADAEERAAARQHRATARWLAVLDHSRGARAAADGEAAAVGNIARWRGGRLAQLTWASF